jgi:two-component system cell cycle sensor histidine kinase/response regulator CckA
MEAVINVLLVEDDPSHAELIERALRGASGRFRLNVAETLAEALSFLSRSVPDLIISDWRLPDGDGLDLLKGGEIRADVPLVLMTSYGNERVAVEAIQSGALDYVVKSVESLSDMPHTVERALWEWRSRRERDRMQAALLASEREYRFLADHVVDVIWTMDFDMKLSFVSPAAEKMYGWTVEEWKRLQPPDYLPPASLALAQQTIAEKVSLQGLPEEQEATLQFEQYRKDGTTFWTEVKARLLRDDQGRPKNIIGVTRDITERKQAEQALAKEKAFSDTVIHSLPGIFFVCDERGLLQRWNDNQNAVTGYTSDELSRMSVLQLFNLDRELMAAHLREVFQSGRAAVEASMVTKSGKALSYYLTGFRMVSNDQRYLVGVGIDISERKQLERQLLQAQKMESMGLLAGGIAHDFNNILTAILGYGSILQMSLGSDTASSDCISQILTSAERAASLTQSLLAFSRKQVLNPRNVDLNESILKIERFLSRVIGEDIELSLSLSDEALMIFVDPTQIEQVLMNLATNARDAMPKGGRLMIATETLLINEEQTRIHGFASPGRYAVLMVSDTGEGMDEQTKAKIFDPFFTTKEIGRGTGLGLSIVYGIVRQSNGYINVYSEPGQGTAFRINFPIVSSPAGGGLPAEVQQPLRGGTETILFAEDNQTIRLLNAGVLKEFGYSVFEAVDGEEALRKFREQRDRIRLLILDVIMPKMSGREVFEYARRSDPSVRGIFTSGYPADLIQKEGVLESGLHFLPKPYSPQTLLRKVREVLDQR